MEAVVFDSWVIKGLFGNLAILKNRMEENPKPSDHWLEEIRKMKDMIDKILADAEKLRP